MSFERLKTTSRIAVDIIRGRALPETLIPKNRNHVEMLITRKDGSTEYIDGYNARTNSGAQWQATTMGGVAGTTSNGPAKFVALSNDTTNAGGFTAPIMGDTVLKGEITAGNGANAGLYRVAGTSGGYVAPTGIGLSATYQITNTFVSSGTTTVTGAALFDAVSVGNLFVEAALAPVATLASGDSIALTWTINV